MRKLITHIVVGETWEAPFRPEDEEYFLQAFKSFRATDLEMAISRIDRNRTNQQNRALFKLLKESGLCAAMGEWDVHDAYHTIEAEYWRVCGGKEGGAKLIKNMSTWEFSAFFAWLQQFASETFGIVIPDPDASLRVTG